MPTGSRPIRRTSTWLSGSPQPGDRQGGGMVRYGRGDQAQNFHQGRFALAVEPLSCRWLPSQKGFLAEAPQLQR